MMRRMISFSRGLQRSALALPLASFAALAIISGCGAPARNQLDPQQFSARAATQTAEMQEIMTQAVTQIMERVDQRGTSEQPVINLLAISGGGDYGAFGSGFLVGWGSVSDPAMQRPDFDAVTGVSTGALLAPFAYLGTNESCLFVDEFYRNPKSNWIEERGLLFFLPSNPSFVTIPGLRKDIQSSVDAAFVGRMAEQSRKGKVLIISATDADLGRQRFWEVGTEAQRAVASGDLTRVHEIMMASSAIPVAFPPVEIDDGLFIDGGVTANIFLRLDTRSPHALLRRWIAERPGQPLPKVRYWVIVNNQMAHIPQTVQRRWPNVMGPALEVSVRSATIAQLQLLAAQADYANAAFNADVEMRVVSIPDDWTPPVVGSFKKETMQSLSDIGRRMGADPASWQLWAAPDRKGEPPAFAR